MHPSPIDDPGLYGRSFATVYDDWYGDPAMTARIVSVLDDLASDGDVLELGVGTGVVARRLSTPGLVVGLDASTEMLDALARADGRPVVPVHGDMASARDALHDSGHTSPFDLIYCSHNTFLNLTTIEAQRSCLRSVAALLRTGGTFVIETIVPIDIDEMPAHSVVASGVPTRGVVFIETSVDGRTGLIHGSHVEVADGVVHVRPWRVLPVSPDALDAMANEAGLEKVEVWADWDRTPFDGTGVRIALHRRR